MATLALVIGFLAAWIIANGRRSGISGRFEVAQQKLDELKKEIELHIQEKQGFYERAIAAETKNEVLSKELDNTQEKLRAEFKNTANNIFESFSDKFSIKSEQKISEILNPLKERLGEFKKNMEESFSAQGKETHTLKAEIEKIVLQTDSLTKALKGDSKAQGNWGEVMLERILEKSGLRSGEEYIVQASGMGLKGDDGSRLQPDVIVNLPDEKHIIIDSKVSLTAYERYCAESDENASKLLIKEFIRSIKAHVNNLSDKSYHNIESLKTPDFVMLFLPIEGAFSLALQEDSDLHSYAWDKKIVLVCPSTMFATLRTIASIWRIERQNLNAQEIARQGGKLYDKIMGFMEDMEKIDEHIGRLQKTYDSARGKLVDGRDNMLRQTEKLKELGIKANKSLPNSLKDKLESDFDEGNGRFIEVEVAEG